MSGIISLSEKKRPGICALTHCNETHDDHVHLNYHIRNHNYGYYSVSAGGLFTATMDKTNMHAAIRHSVVITVE